MIVGAFSEKKIVKIIKGGLYLILLTPLFFHRSFIGPFIGPKIFIFQALTEIIFALWLSLIIFYPRHRPRLTAISAALFIFIAVLTISSFLGIDWHRSFWSAQERSLGLFALFHFFALFLMLGSLKTEINWRNYFLVSLIVSFIAALFAVIQLVQPSLFLEKVNDRPGSFLGNPTFLAAYLLFHIFIGLWLVNLTKSHFVRLTPILIFIVVLFEIVVIFLTQTRGALIGLMAGFIFLLIYFFIYGSSTLIGRFNLRKLSASFLVLMAVFSGIFWFTRTAEIWQKIPILARAAKISLDTPDLLPRVIALNISWKSFLERPFFGWGWENFKYPFDKHYDPRLLRLGFTETYFDKPHNIFLEYLVTGGAVGFLSFWGVLAAVFYSIYNYRSAKDATMTPVSDFNIVKPFFGAAFTAYIVQNVFVFDTFGSYLMFFIMAAFIDSSSNSLFIFGGRKFLKTNFLKEKIFSISSKFLKPEILTPIFLILILLPVYFINYKVLYANNKQYWGLNYFLNRMPELALDSYADTLTTPNPYRDQARKDFASAVVQIYQQGIKIPEVDKVAAKAMEELAKAINHHPRDYFLRLSFADHSADFYQFDSNYIKLGEAEAMKALVASPKRQQIYYALAKIKILKGEKLVALDLMKKAVELDPESGDPHFYHGLLALETGNQDLGFTELARAKELGREYKSAGEARVIANYYADAEDYHNAVLYYQRALGLNSDDLETKLKLGIVYFYQGRNDLAKEKISEVLKSLPDFRHSPNFEAVRPIIEALGL